MLLDLFSQIFPYAAKFPVTVGIGFAALNDYTAFGSGAFGNGDHRVVARVIPLIVAQQLGQRFAVKGHFTNDTAICLRQIRRYQ